jgi:hypothetical protein
VKRSRKPVVFGCDEFGDPPGVADSVACGTVIAWVAASAPALRRERVPPGQPSPALRVVDQSQPFQS